MIPPAKIPTTFDFPARLGLLLSVRTTLPRKTWRGDQQEARHFNCCATPATPRLGPGINVYDPLMLCVLTSSYWQRGLPDNSSKSEGELPASQHIARSNCR